MVNGELLTFCVSGLLATFLVLSEILYFAGIHGHFQHYYIATGKNAALAYPGLGRTSCSFTTRGAAGPGYLGTVYGIRAEV